MWMSTPKPTLPTATPRSAPARARMALHVFQAGVVLLAALMPMRARGDCMGPSTTMRDTFTPDGTARCGARCTFILPGDVTGPDPVSFVGSEAGIPTVPATVRLLIGRVQGQPASLVQSTGQLLPGTYQLVRQGRTILSVLVTEDEAQDPGSHLVKATADLGDIAGNTCRDTGPPLPWLSVYKVTAHHLKATLSPAPPNGSTADVWVLPEDAAAPVVDLAASPAGTNPPPLAEHLSLVEPLSTRGLEGTPLLETGKRFKFAVRVVNADGVPGPISVSNTVTITEWETYVGCQQTGPAFWQGLLLLLFLARRRSSTSSTRRTPM